MSLLHVMRVECVCLEDFRNNCIINKILIHIVNLKLIIKVILNILKSYNVIIMFYEFSGMDEAKIWGGGGLKPPLVYSYVSCQCTLENSP